MYLLVPRYLIGIASVCCLCRVLPLSLCAGFECLILLRSFAALARLLGRVVRPTIGATDHQPMHPPLLGVQQHDGAMSAGVVNHLCACGQNRWGIKRFVCARCSNHFQRLSLSLSHEPAAKSLGPTPALCCARSLWPHLCPRIGRLRLVWDFAQRRLMRDVCRALFFTSVSGVVFRDKTV